MKYFVDTNIFIRTLIKDDEEQFNFSLNFLKAIKKNQIKGCTSTLVLAELVWTLTSFYKFEKEKAVRALKSILNLRGLEIYDKYDYFKAVELYEKYSIKFIDALIASNPEILEKKIIIVSFDKDFDKLTIIRKEPKEILIYLNKQIE